MSELLAVWALYGLAMLGIGVWIGFVARIMRYFPSIKSEDE